MSLLLAVLIAAVLVLLTSVLWTFLRTTTRSRELPLMTLEELHCYAGRAGHDVIYVGVHGVVYVATFSNE